MFCRGPDQAFSPSRVTWLLPHPPNPFVSSTDVTPGKTEKYRQLAARRGGGGGAKSYDSEKAWSSISHPILSGSHLLT